MRVGQAAGILLGAILESTEENGTASRTEVGIKQIMTFDDVMIKIYRITLVELYKENK